MHFTCSSAQWPWSKSRSCRGDAPGNPKWCIDMCKRIDKPRVHTHLGSLEYMEKKMKPARKNTVEKKLHIVQHKNEIKS